MKNRFFLILSSILLVLASVSSVFADQPITIDGIKYTKYAYLTKRYIGPSIYSNFADAVNSGYSVIIVDADTFSFSGTVTVRRNGLLITGISKESSKIIETNPERDLLQIYANNVTVKNLTLDTKTHNAQAAFVVGDGVSTEAANEYSAGNNITLTKTNILGGNKIFALYYAGPTYKSSIFDRYSANNLSTGNIITNNYIEGSYAGDAFIFALQRNGLIQGNTFSGGQLDVYLSRNSLVDSNTIINSNKSGILLVGPADSITVTNNQISKAKESGIRSYYPEYLVPANYVYNYITHTNIKNNTITDITGAGMDMNYFAGGLISGNTIARVGGKGISLSNNSFQNTIEKNTVTEFGGLSDPGMSFSMDSSSNMVSSNTLTNPLARVTGAGVLVESRDSINNTFTANTIRGNFTNACIVSYGKTLTLTNNILTNLGGGAIMNIIP